MMRVRQNYHNSHGGSSTYDTKAVLVWRPHHDQFHLIKNFTDDMIVRRQSVSSGYSSRLSSHWPEVRCLAGISMRLVRVMTNTERVKYQSVMYQKYSLSNQEDIRLAKSRPKTTTRLSQTLHMVSLFCQPIQRIQSKTDRLNASGQRPTVSETQSEDQERTRFSFVAKQQNEKYRKNIFTRNF